jgi:NAD+ synthase (glutamine-hydrolysing)
MSRKAPFEAIHRHGFVRVGAASPTASAGDVVFNVEQAITIAAQADGRGCDLLVFP